MKSILFVMISLAVFMLSAQTAISAEITYPSEELTYTSGFDIDTAGPISINWKGNWMSISLLTAAAGYDNARLQAYVTFGAYPSGRSEMPLSLSIRIQEAMEPLDVAILPESYREGVATISQMATMTLERDKEAGKLTDAGVVALERLRDRFYTLSALSGGYIDVRWSTEYAGKTATRSLNYTNTDMHCAFKFTGNAFTAELRKARGFSTITANYNSGSLDGGYRKLGTAEALTEKDALILFKHTLNTIEAIYKTTGTKIPDEMAADLLLAKKAFAKGFRSYAETPYPAGPVIGRT